MSASMPSAPPSGYVSAAERLRALPLTFSIEQMCTLQGLSKAVGLKYLSRWAQAGSVRSAGPRAGFYANLVRAPELAESNDWLAAAMLHVYPSATVIGASVLNAAGWITQHPHAVQVAVLAPANRSSVWGFEPSPRARRWFVRMGDLIVRPRAARPAGFEHAPQLPQLTPAAALADLFASSPSSPSGASNSPWLPDEDDIEIPDEALGDVVHAFMIMKAPMPQWLQLQCQGMLDPKHQSCLLSNQHSL
jgi:hypothetical protein